MFENADIYGGLAGGAIVGLAAAMLWIFQGKVAGISGIFGGMLDRSPDWPWRIMFVSGLVVGGLVLAELHPSALPTQLPGGTFTLMFAGLLVGLGTRVGNGCTSGHGVCGVSRLSRRSIVATAAFLTSGAVAVFVSQHVMGGGL